VGTAARAAHEGLTGDHGAMKADACSGAMAINSKEQIVGESDDCTGNNAHASLWEKSSIIDLNSFVPLGSGVQLTVGLSINERGEIAAQGVLSNGDIHAFVLIPCGEGTEGCRDAAESTTVVTPAHASNGGTMLPQFRPTPSAAWRSRLAHRYHIPGVEAPKE